MKTKKKEKKSLWEDAFAGEYVSPEIKESIIMAVNFLCRSDQNITYGGYTNGEEEGY